MTLTYLNGYPADTVQQIETMLQEQRLGPWLLKKYPQPHGLRDDRALFGYVQELKQDYLKGATPINKVLYDNKLQLVKNALGTHTTISRVQGSRLLAKRDIRIASLRKDPPLEFLRMSTVHELAHLREPGRIADALAQYLSATIEQRQQVLQSANVVQRLGAVMGMMKA